jgi:hypothetical protein
VASITWDDVKAVAANDPKVSSAPPATQAIVLAYVNAELDPCAFQGGEGGPRIKIARAYLAAHLASLGPHTAVLTSMKEDDVSIGYTLPPIPVGDDPFWQRTAYGSAYRALVNTSYARLPFVT